MARKAYLAPHYSSAELKKKYLKSKDSVESLVMAFTLENLFRMDN